MWHCDILRARNAMTLVNFDGNAHSYVSPFLYYELYVELPSCSHVLTIDVDTALLCFKHELFTSYIFHSELENVALFSSFFFMERFVAGKFSLLHKIFKNDKFHLIAKKKYSNGFSIQRNNA